MATVKQLLDESMKRLGSRGAMPSENFISITPMETETDSTYKVVASGYAASDGYIAMLGVSQSTSMTSNPGACTISANNITQDESENISGWTAYVYVPIKKGAELSHCLMHLPEEWLTEQSLSTAVNRDKATLSTTSLSTAQATMPSSLALSTAVQKRQLIFQQYQKTRGGLLSEIRRSGARLGRHHIYQVRPMGVPRKRGLLPAKEIYSTFMPLAEQQSKLPFFRNISVNSFCGGVA